MTVCTHMPYTNQSHMHTQLTPIYADGVGTLHVVRTGALAMGGINRKTEVLTATIAEHAGPGVDTGSKPQL